MMFGRPRIESPKPNITAEMLELNNRIRALEDNLDKAHIRCDLLNRRCEHLEHYLGLRSHKFPDGEQMWRFFQVRNDVGQQDPPKSLFDLGINNKKKRVA